MHSIEIIPTIECIPLRNKHGHYNAEAIIRHSAKIRNSLFSIEIAAGVEQATEMIFDARNVPDDLEKAYQLAFPNTALEHSLHEHYKEMLESGPESTTGFINALKGKLFETRLVQTLESDIPNYNFKIADSPNQPIWDIIGIPNDGTDPLYIQAKMGDTDYASEVINHMHEDPNVLFAVSQEIRNQISATNPELIDQLIIGTGTNYEFAANIESDMSVLADQMGIDLPDSIGDILPYVSEIVLGIKLLCDIIQTEKEYRMVNLNDKSRINVMKTLVLVSRFGISTVCVIAFGAIGGAVGLGLPGGIAGSFTGAYFAGKLNKSLSPRIREIAMMCAQLTEDDLFYFRNKVTIDAIGASFSNTYVH